VLFTPLLLKVIQSKSKLCEDKAPGKLKPEAYLLKKDSQSIVTKYKIAGSTVI
jgi:hypothetical protein